MPDDIHAGALSKGTYRQYLPKLDIPRFASMQKQDAHEYAAEFKKSGGPPWLYALYLHWLELLKDPLKGITTDGTKTESLGSAQTND
jgi:hypothetical protein